MLYSQVSRCKNGVKIIWTLIDVSKIFKNRDVDNERNWSVYRVVTPDGRTVYFGKGIYYYGKSYDYNVAHMRATNHRGDMLANTLCEGWTIEIIAIGLTDKESRILEAKLIRDAGKPLSKKGIYVWDGVSLINKRRERKLKIWLMNI